MSPAVIAVTCRRRHRGRCMRQAIRVAPVLGSAPSRSGRAGRRRPSARSWRPRRPRTGGDGRRATGPTDGRAESSTSTSSTACSARRDQRAARRPTGSTLLEQQLEAAELPRGRRAPGDQRRRCTTSIKTAPKTSATASTRSSSRPADGASTPSGCSRRCRCRARRSIKLVGQLPHGVARRARVAHRSARRSSSRTRTATRTRACRRPTCEDVPAAVQRRDLALRVPDRSPRPTSPTASAAEGRPRADGRLQRRPRHRPVHGAARGRLGRQPPRGRATPSAIPATGVSCTSGRDDADRRPLKDPTRARSRSGSTSSS